MGLIIDADDGDAIVLHGNDTIQHKEAYGGIIMLRGADGLGVSIGLKDASGYRVNKSSARLALDDVDLHHPKAQLQSNENNYIMLHSAGLELQAYGQLNMVSNRNIRINPGMSYSLVLYSTEFKEQDINALQALSKQQVRTSFSCINISSEAGQHPEIVYYDDGTNGTSEEFVAIRNWSGARNGEWLIRDGEIEYSHHSSGYSNGFIKYEPNTIGFSCGAASLKLHSQNGVNVAGTAYSCTIHPDGGLLMSISPKEGNANHPNASIKYTPVVNGAYITMGIDDAMNPYGISIGYIDNVPYLRINLQNDQIDFSASDLYNLKSLCSH